MFHSNMDIGKLKNLKRCVEWVLDNYPETRNSDVLLTVQLWKSYCADYIIDKEYIKLDNIKLFPREDHIGRIRRSFQEKGRYIPTDRKIFDDRKIQQEFWHSAFASNPVNQ